MSVQDEMLADHQRMWHNFCRGSTIMVVLVVIVLAGLGIFCL